MKTVSLLVGVTLACSASSLLAATTIVSDNFTASNVNSGFLLGEGLNSGINPPATRLNGTAAADLRYLKKGNKGDSAYTISGNKCNITQGSQSGRFTISADGVTAFDFGPALAVANATPANPVVYDVGISMNNKVSVTDTPLGRMTFAFGTVEGGGGNWSFGIQIVPAISGGTTNYNVIKRIKAAASGLGAELNASIANTGTPGSEISFLMRVTDAGAETDTNYNSRVQVSVDGGASWIYDTKTDPSLTNGWRFEAATRFVSFDQAPNGGADTYDNFFIALPDPLIWTGADAQANWSTGANWLRGVPPITGPTVVTGDALVFSGTTQQANVNDITDLSVSSVTFSNGGFSLSGSPFTVTTAITNVMDQNIVANDIFLGANTRFHAAAGEITFQGGINSTGRNLTVSGTGSTVINGAIDTGSGALTKQTAGGTLTLNGNNSYTGNTTVSQGTLAINGAIASPNVNISAAGTLGGTGVVSGAVSVTGSLSAGNGVGKLTTGAVTLNNNGTNVFEISNVSGVAGVDWDLVDAGINNVDVQAAEATPFKVRLVANGLGNFDKDTTYSWPAITGAVQNFSSGKFLVLDSEFANDLAGGTFTIEAEANSLNVRFVNNQAPAASATNLSFAAGTPFQFPIADLLALTSDPDGDARALVSLTSTNATVSEDGTTITISSSTATTESIAYVVKDVRNYRAGDTVRTATNLIHIVVTNAPGGGGTFAISNDGGSASLTFQGNPGQNYIIERSQDLNTWVGISTNTATGSGAIQFSEVPPTNPAFYRSRTE